MRTACVLVSFASGLQPLKQGRAGFGDFLVLLRAFRSAATDGTDDLAFVNNRHAALQGREIWQRSHGETAFVDRVLEVLRRLLENRGRAGFADGNIRSGRETLFWPDEVEQVPAVVHHRDGRAGAVVFRIFRGGFAGLLRAFECKFVLGGDVTLGAGCSSVNSGGATIDPPPAPTIPLGDPVNRTAADFPCTYTITADGPPNGPWWDTLSATPAVVPWWDTLSATLAVVLFLLGRTAEAETSARAVLYRTADRGRKAHMRWILAYSLLRSGRAAEAAAELRQALDDPELPETWHARLLALAAMMQAGTAGDVDAAEAAARRALAIDEAL